MGFRRRLGVAAGIVLLLAGCNGDGRGNGGEIGAQRPDAQRRTEILCREARERIRQVNPDASNYRGEAEASDVNVTVKVQDFSFSPTCVIGLGRFARVAGGRVMLGITNDSQAMHNVSVPEQGINQDFGPGQTVSVPVAVRGGDVTYFCRFHQNLGMLGVLVSAGR